jgi:nicotinamidase-related amidase
VIDKSAPSAFQGTDLEPILSAHGVRATIFAGVTTDVCVTSTLRDAGSRNYECMLAVDACGSGDPEAHRGALHLMTVQDGIHGVMADVATIEEALARVAA